MYNVRGVMMKRIDFIAHPQKIGNSLYILVPSYHAKQINLHLNKKYQVIINGEVKK